MTGEYHVSIRELANNASRVVRDVAESRETKLITKHGKPVAAIVPIDEKQLAQLFQAAIPELAEELADMKSSRANGVVHIVGDPID